MRIISRSTLTALIGKKKYANARGELAVWLRVAERAEWKQLLDLQKDFSSAEAVPIRKESYTVFNICHNEFRLVVLVYYQKGIIWIKDFLTPREYDTNNWKKILESSQVEREKLVRKYRRSKE